jgi:hypothetical protein
MEREKRLGLAFGVFVAICVAAGIVVAIVYHTPMLVIYVSYAGIVLGIIAIVVCAIVAHVRGPRQPQPSH